MRKTIIGTLRDDAEQVERDKRRAAENHGLLPPLRGLDQHAGDVEGGVIGGRKRRRRQPHDGGWTVLLLLVAAVLVVLAGAVLAVAVGAS